MKEEQLQHPQIAASIAVVKGSTSMVQIIPLIIKLVSYIHYLVNLVKYH
jgi:hypothetical protein